MEYFKWNHIKPLIILTSDHIKKLFTLNFILSFAQLLSNKPLLSSNIYIPSLHKIFRLLCFL